MSRFCALIGAVLVCDIGQLSFTLAQGKLPKPLPADIVGAWQQAGATVGFIAPHTSGSPIFRPATVPMAGERPAFSFFRMWKAGIIGKLPSPEQAFGLVLSETNLDDASLKELAPHKSLEVLFLAQTKIADAGLKELAPFKHLKVLSLSTTGVTDAGLKELAGLAALETLFLHKTKVTDAGLKELASLKNLKTLGLSATKITDAGLKELAGFKSLQKIDVKDTAVTDTGVADLAKAMPKLIILR